ncbi:hypothetical protein L596_000603 [Steinernema carpocapsae]|uniref:Uncharacterized protein n=1 Tax=Steinernema carpocapsae TaxID=34508 RepID=A0A4U8UIQ8_STECR|nr:hypothetical protein L596_000603 [Steinernema carpocapsae]
MAKPPVDRCAKHRKAVRALALRQEVCQSTPRGLLERPPAQPPRHSMLFPRSYLQAPVDCSRSQRDTKAAASDIHR